MAKASRSYPDNEPGLMFVDRTCIDCGTCYEMVPGVFEEADDHSRVKRQPVTEEEKQRSLMALVACPTGSIGTRERVDMSEAVEAFPEKIDGEIYFCGYTSEKSFGAWSWLIRRSEGNVLIDSPRASEHVMRRIEKLGGAKWMILTHRDDVADQARFQERFGFRRVMHERDRDAVPGGVEVLVRGNEPSELEAGLTIIPTPGHTPGHVVVLYKNEWLFTGDHLWGSPARGFPSASKSVCWYSWDEQIRSVERLLSYDFRWILPGHGPIHRAESPAAMRRDLARTLDFMRRR